MCLLLTFINEFLISIATMVGERCNGNLLVQLGPRLQAYPEELIRQRRTHDGQTEYLIRWSLVSTDNGSSSGGGVGEVGGTGSSSSAVGGSGSSTSGETKPENILMWMTTEDVYANCPTLLGKRKTDSQRPLQQQENQQGGAVADGGQSSGGEFPTDVTFDEVELSDMEEDVKNLVCRARKQMAKKSDFSINIMHTIHVLSAYASIGSLVGVFKETGALNLLMELLCNKETQTRRSAGKMLRALASHDAGKNCPATYSAAGRRPLWGSGFGFGPAEVLLCCDGDALYVEPHREVCLYPAAVHASTLTQSVSHAYRVMQNFHLENTEEV